MRRVLIWKRWWRPRPQRYRRLYRPSPSIWLVSVGLSPTDLPCQGLVCQYPGIWSITGHTVCVRLKKHSLFYLIYFLQIHLHSSAFFWRSYHCDPSEGEKHRFKPVLQQQDVFVCHVNSPNIINKDIIIWECTPPRAKPMVIIPSLWFQFSLASQQLYINLMFHNIPRTKASGATQF